MRCDSIRRCWPITWRKRRILLTPRISPRRERRLPGADNFDTNLVDPLLAIFPMRPNDAHYIGDPTDNAFEDCFSSHSWLQIILLADRRSRAGLPDFTDEYYDRFYNQAGAVVIRQLSDAATEVGSYWLTAWTNAGKLAFPQH